MASEIPYDTSAKALLNPATDAVFFRGWEPGVDDRNYDLLCAEMSRLAYAGPGVVTRALARIGFCAVGFIAGEDSAARMAMHGTQGFVAKSPAQGLSVLAFRGTEAKRFDHLISDLDTLQTDFRDGSRVHAGFLKAYGPQVQQRVATLLREREGTLLVTGHSLGAALATLAAVDTHPHPTALITFGSPRVGDAKFARLCQRLTVHRFVNCCDVVPRIPPEKFDREHVLQLLTELTHFKPFALLRRSLDKASQAAANVAASVLAAPFQSVASVNKFTHICPRRYVRADGTIAEEISEKQIADDQQTARADYHRSTVTGLKQLQTLIRSTCDSPGGPTFEHLGQLSRNFVGGLFNLICGDPVPLRDLADHAPINYVSAFTGRGQRAV